MAVQTDLVWPDSENATPQPRSRTTSNTTFSDRLSMQTPELSISDTTTDTRHFLSGDVPADFSLGVPGVAEDKTMALGLLLDRVTKLLARLKAADLATLETRFKRQNLPGDVRHLSKTTLKDIVRPTRLLRPTSDAVAVGGD
jgi:hypothetical protein